MAKLVIPPDGDCFYACLREAGFGESIEELRGIVADQLTEAQLDTYRVQADSQDTRTLKDGAEKHTMSDPYMHKVMKAGHLSSLDTLRAYVREPRGLEGDDFAAHVLQRHFQFRIALLDLQRQEASPARWFADSEDHPYEHVVIMMLMKSKCHYVRNSGAPAPE